MTYPSNKMPFVRTPRNTEPVPLNVVLAMRDAFLSDTGCCMNDRDRAMAILRVADRNLQCCETRRALQECIQSTQPKCTIDWEKAELVPSKMKNEREVEWIMLAVENHPSGAHISDDLIAWLVHDMNLPVSEYALECACRNDWCATTLPILLASKNLPDKPDIVLKYAFLHPAQLALLPQQFQAVGKTLFLSPHVSWIYTAARAAYAADATEEGIVLVRAALEPLLQANRVGNGASAPLVMSVAGLFSQMEGNATTLTQVDVAAHLAWMNSRLVEHRITVVF